MNIVFASLVMFFYAIGCKPQSTFPPPQGSGPCSSNSCDTNASCYTILNDVVAVCQCYQGYIGDGFNCTVDPCIASTCGWNSTCELLDENGNLLSYDQTNPASTLPGNVVEAYPTCICTGTTDYPNCSTCCCPTTNNCHENAICQIIPSSNLFAYSCTCKPGFTGINCTAPPSTTVSSAYFTYTDENNDSYLNVTVIPSIEIGGIPNPCVNITCAESATCQTEVFRDGQQMERPFILPVLYGVWPNDTVVSQCVCNQYFTGDPYVYCAPTCFVDRLYIDGGTYTFPSTIAPQSAYSWEKCPYTGQPMATAQCKTRIGETGDLEPYFANRLLVPCTDESVESIVSEISVEQLNTSALATILTYLDVITSNTESLESGDVTATASFINDVAENATTARILPDSYLRIINIADHVTAFYVSTNHKSGVTETQMVRSLMKLAYKIPRSPHTNVLSVSTPNIEAEVSDNRCPNRDIQYSPYVTFFQNFTTYIPFQPVSVTVPLEALLLAERQTSDDGRRRRKRALSAVRAVFLVHRSSALFSSPEAADWVVSAEVGDQTTPTLVHNLADMVNITRIDVKQTRGKAQYVNETCVFWNYSTERWSTEGCCMEPNTNPPQCKCNHLTSFAMLVSVYPIPPSIPQQIVSIVGCSLSVACLIVTIILLLISKEIRSRRPMIVLMNICGNLSVVYLIFLFGVDQREHEAGCIASATLLHYFLLVTWFWMAVYAHLLYKSIVKIFDVSWDNYLLKACGLSYVLPMVVVLINLMLNKIYEVPSNETPVCGQDPPSAFVNTYLASNMCWIQGYSLYFAFLLPMGCLLAFNIVMFILVITSLTCKRKKVSSTSKNPTNLHNLSIALLIASTLGLVWFFAFFMMISDDPKYLEAMSWLFTIFSCFQGFCVFVLTCLRQGEVQRVWLGPIQKLLYRKREKKEDTSVVSTSHTGISRGPEAISIGVLSGLGHIKYGTKKEINVSTFNSKL